MKMSDEKGLPKISVLIGTRNRPEALIRCLRSVLAQDYPNFEVLVLDDASDAYNVCEFLQELANSRIRCFRVPEPLGVAGGRNRLMELAEGDVFCVIDDDAYFDDLQALNKIANIFIRNADVGIVAVKVIDHQDKKTSLLVPFPKWALICHPGLVDEETDVSYFLGTCHAIRRKVIQVCGLYQSELMYGEEELDLSYRAVEAGFRIRYIPEITVHHCPQDSVVKSHKFMRRPELYYHVRNRILLARKYLPLHFATFYIIFWMLRSFISALRSGTVMELIQGIVAGIQFAKKAKRTPLSQEAIGYLRKHHGRLWY